MLGSAAIGTIVGGVVALASPWQLAVLVGWNVTAAVVIARVWFRVGRFDAAETSRAALREDDSRRSSELLLVSASVSRTADASLRTAGPAAHP